ncbi:MAG: hypothetical protein ACJAYU_005104, partial [Bradymonadia bacterium]
PAPVADLGAKSGAAEVAKELKDSTGSWNPPLVGRETRSSNSEEDDNE